MGGIGTTQIIIVAVLAVLLFGRGKISELMGDVAKGIKSFKKGMKDDDDATEADVAGRVTTDHVKADGTATAGVAEPIDVTPRKEREGA